MSYIFLCMTIILSFLNFWEFSLGFERFDFFNFLLGFSCIYYHASHPLFLKALLFLTKYLMLKILPFSPWQRHLLSPPLSLVVKFRIVLFALTQFATFGETSRYGVFLVFYEGLGTECDWNNGYYKKSWLFNYYVFSSISISIAISIIIIKRAEQKSLVLAKH